MQRRSMFFNFSDANGLDICEKIAQFMAVALNWDEEKTLKEIDNYKRVVNFKEVFQNSA